MDASKAIKKRFIIIYAVLALCFFLSGYFLSSVINDRSKTGIANDPSDQTSVFAPGNSAKWPKKPLERV